LTIHNFLIYNFCDKRTRPKAKKAAKGGTEGVNDSVYGSAKGYSFDIKGPDKTYHKCGDKNT
jgi:hypothetical protein